MRSATGALLLSLFIVSPAFGQSTNLSLYQDLAVACLGELPPEVDSLVVESPDRMPFLRSALVARWQEEGRAVFLPDSALAAAHLSYSIEQAEVSYEKRRRQLAREVRLSLRYTLTNGMGRVLVDDRCIDSRSDLIARGALAGVQNAAYPETQGELPEAGWIRRVVEPVVLTAATAVVVYLFFTLRSSDSDS